MPLTYLLILEMYICLLPDAAQFFLFITYLIVICFKHAEKSKK